MTADDALTPEARRELEAMDAALAGRPVEPELTELGALALALRDGRPQPRPGFTRDLDARAAAGFPRRRRFRVPRPSLPVLIPGTALAAVAALVITVAVVGGNGSFDEQGDSAGGGSTAAQSTEESAPQGGQADRSSASPPAPATVAPGSGAGSAASDSRAKRFVERSAALTLATPPARIDRAAADVVAVTERLGGFVAAQSVTSTADGGGGEFALRIPTGRLAEALSQLSRVATVRERSQNAQDITAARVSAKDRLTTAQAYKRSLERRLAAATAEAEALELRDALDRVDRRIAGFRATLARVDNRAAYANVAVTLVADRDAGGTVPTDGGSSWSPADAAKDALRVLEVAAGIVLVALAVALPIGIVLALLLAARQIVVRRGRQRVLDVTTI